MRVVGHLKEGAVANLMVLERLKRTTNVAKNRRQMGCASNRVCQRYGCRKLLCKGSPET